MSQSCLNVSETKKAAKGKRLTNVERLHLLTLLFNRENYNEIMKHKKPVPYARQLLYLKYNLEVSHHTVLNLLKNWKCTYNENGTIKDLERL